MKVSIFSFAANDKFPIDIQSKQYQKYLEDDFEFLLFNDAFLPEMQKTIETITSYNNINCINVPQSIHRVQNPSEGYAATLNWAVREFAVSRGCELVLLVHADVLPIQKLSIGEIIKDNFIASTMEYRKVGDKDIYYLYPALTILNMKAIGELVSTLDFSVSLGLDTGGMTHSFVEQHNDLVKRLDNIPANNMLEKLPSAELKEYLRSDLQICTQCHLNEGWFCEGLYHYMAGSQWNSNDSVAANGHAERMKLFLKYFY